MCVFAPVGRRNEIEIDEGGRLLPVDGLMGTAADGGRWRLPEMGFSGRILILPPIVG